MILRLQESCIDTLLAINNKNSNNLFKNRKPSPKILVYRRFVISVELLTGQRKSTPLSHR